MTGRASFVILLIAFCLNGCVQFTQRDYELQEKAYKKEQEQRDAEKENTVQLKW